MDSRLACSLRVCIDTKSATFIFFRHGDDFVLLGTREDQKWFQEASKEHVIMMTDANAHVHSEDDYDVANA